MRDIALARLTGGAGPLPAPVDRRARSRMVRAAKAGGLPVTAEATPHHFTLTDERCSAYDPVFKVNPPLRTDGRRRRGQGRAGRRHHRRDRHRSRPARAGDEGAAVRPGAPGHARPRDGAGAGPRPSSTCRSSDVLALLSWRPAPIAGLDERHGGPIEPRAAPRTSA